jgi:hypothetical protein
MLMQVRITVGVVLIIVVVVMLQDWSRTNEFWDVDVTTRRTFNRGGELLEFVGANFSFNMLLRINVKVGVEDNTLGR